MVIVMTGPAGSGKSFVGSRLAAAAGCAFVEGDAFHPPQNVARMREGTPLTDADRGPWLAALGAEVARRARAGGCVVVACSALKRAYRETLAAAVDAPLRFVFLRAPAELLRARVAARPGHFFPEELLSSQLDDLEPPSAGEDVLVLDGARPAEALVQEIIRALPVM